MMKTLSWRLLKVFRRLKDQGYNGVVTVEYACPGDGFIAARRDKEYVDILTDWLEISRS